MKLRGLRDKHVLRVLASGFLPREVWARPKQPYRAPDAPSFVGGESGDLAYVGRVLSPEAVLAAGIFDAGGITRLKAKCEAQADRGQFSNSDNMAFIGALSTQLLWERLIDNPQQPEPLPLDAMKTVMISRGERGG
jgi:asparagine synthase (glutamine-hydrolysing)